MKDMRILTMQDISCIGQCSMTVALPILSACGLETCILPTAVLSTHTGGFGAPAVQHLAGGIGEIRKHWLSAGITFDAILTGYLGSLDAVREAEMIMDTMLAPGGKVIVDPAMADHGKLYAGLDKNYAAAMKELCLRADVMLPNITEAAMMAGMEWREDTTRDYILGLMQSLGGRDVVLTGVSFSPEHTGAAIRSGEHIHYYQHARTDKSYHGTGDIFAACFTGAWMRGKNLEDAVRIAADVTARCIENTFAAPAHWYGVKFETALPYLISLLTE